MRKHMTAWVTGVWIALSATGGSAPAGEVFWVPDADGSWTQAGNWSSNPLLPGPNDNVTINVAGDRLITLSSGQTIGSLMSNERIDIAGLTDLSVVNSAQVGGTLRLLGNAGLVGGTYTTVNGSEVLVATGRMNGVTLNGDVSMPYDGATLQATNGLTLNGTLHLDGKNATLVMPSGMAIGGSATVSLEGTPNVSQPQILLGGAGTTFTFEPSVRIHGGTGWIGLPVDVNSGDRTIVNQGVIEADVAGQSIRVDGSSRTLGLNNTGTLRASGGGTLDLLASPMSNAGTIEASGLGSAVNVSGAWVNNGMLSAVFGGRLNLAGEFTLAPGGFLSTAGGSVAIVNGGALRNSTLNLNNNTGSWILSNGRIVNSTVNLAGATLAVSPDNRNELSGVTLNGDLPLTADGAYLGVTNGLTFNGTLSMTDAKQANLVFGGAQTIGGNATIVLGGAGGSGGLVGIDGSGTTLTIGPGVTLRGGRSQVGLSYAFADGDRTLLNQGQISADVPGEEVQFVSGKPLFVTNAGTLRATNGSMMTILNTTLTNQGIIEATAGGDIDLRAAIQSSSGILRADGGTIQIMGNNPFAAGAGSVTVLNGDLGRLILWRGFDNAGAFNWTGGSVIANGGHLGGASDGVFNNLGGATFTVSSAGSFSNAQNSSGNAFNNAGAFSKTGSAITIFDVPFTNLAGGGVTVDGGTLVLSGGGENRGTFTINKGATARFSKAFTHAAGSTLIAGGDVAFEAAVYELAGNLFIDGELSFNSASATVRAGASATRLALVNSFASVAAGGQLTVGAGGINFNGDAISAVTLQPSDTTPGRLLLGGDVSFTGASGRGELNTADFATGQTPGVLDLGGTARTFTVNDGSAEMDLKLSARLINGSIVKAGLGTMRLDGPNLGLGGVAVAAGTLEVTDPASLGAGPVTVGDATLALRSDSVSPGIFAGDVHVTGDGTIRVDRVTIGGAGTMKLGNVSVGGTRLTVEGANGRALEIAGLALGGAATLDVQAPTTINGVISQTSAGAGFTKSGGAEKLSLTGPGANAYTGLTRVNAGLLELNKPAGVVAVPGDLAIFGGTVHLSADGEIAATSNVTVANAGSALDLGGHSNTVASLAITGGAVTFGTGPSVLRVNGAFSVAGGGRLDVGSNRLIVDYAAGGTSAALTVHAALALAYANGNWSGPGIGTAAGVVGRSLGFAEASEALGAGGGTFGGQAVDASAVLVRYTLEGDATLNGTVDFNDLVRIAQNYNTTVTGASTWYRGDFNYDGVVDFQDLVKLAQNYNTSAPGGAAIAGASASFDGDLARAFASVPEPGAGAMAIVAMTALWRRRGPR